MTTSAPSPENILQTGFAFWASKSLLSAVEMGVFTELARTGPQHLDELSSRLGLHPRSSRDFLDTLVALRFLRRTDNNYANTPETDSSSTATNPPTSVESSRSRASVDWSKAP